MEQSRKRGPADDADLPHPSPSRRPRTAEIEVSGGLAGVRVDEGTDISATAANVVEHTKQAAKDIMVSDTTTVVIRQNNVACSFQICVEL